VEPVQFNQGYYTIDIRFYFRISLDVYTDITRPKRVEGIAVYDKKIALFGSEGKSKVFRSSFNLDAPDKQIKESTNLPKAVVEVVDPIALDARLVEKCSDNICNNCCDINSIPECICNCLEGVLSQSDTERRVYVTLGLFTITKLERNVQLLIPVYDFCIPTDECVSASPGNPCELFDQIQFPVDEFFPPQKHDFFCNTNCN